jgi:hypothetical protein
MAKLGQVPDAAALGGVAAKDYALAAEPLQAPSLAPGFSATGATDLPPGFWKAAGIIWLQGTVTGGPGIAFTLPAGYRPAGDAHFADIDVEADGDVVIPAGTPSLDGIAFRAAP